MRKLNGIFYIEDITMSKKIVFVDPDNNYEIVEDSRKRADDFNKANPECQPMTAQDMDDLNQMLLEAGLLEKIIIQ